jgi:hypothetical protein
LTDKRAADRERRRRYLKLALLWLADKVMGDPVGKYARDLIYRVLVPRRGVNALASAKLVGEGRVIAVASLVVNGGIGVPVVKVIGAPQQG